MDPSNLASPIQISQNLLSRDQQAAIFNSSNNTPAFSNAEGLPSSPSSLTAPAEPVQISSGFSKNPTKAEIVRDWLPRYTGKTLDSFGSYVLLCNFINYVEIFAKLYGVEVEGRDKPFASATHDGLTILCIGMGAAGAATSMDLLTALPQLKAVLFCGKCGGLRRKTTIGSYILPIGAIRKEGASDAYARPELPALPAFNLQRSVSTTLRQFDRDYYTGTIYTTCRRVWEHDEAFKAELQEYRALGIDMETATLFVTGFVNKIPTGALLLVSDQPLVSEGIKSSASDTKVTGSFVEEHIRIGVESLRKIQQNNETVRHLKW